MDLFITSFIANFPFLMTLCALMLGFLHLCFYKNTQKCDIILSYLFFIALGLSGCWGFIMHACYPELSARYIGWAPSPFQFEVALANLGMGLVGLFGTRASKSYRIAGVIFATTFLWGAAAGHIKQMILYNNYHPGNAGLIFYNDLILPAILILMLMICPRFKHQFLR